MARFRTNEGFETTGPLTLSASRITSNAEISLSGSRTINSGSLIIPQGGGINGGGHGLAIGSSVAYEAIYVEDGNIWLQGSGETTLSVKRTGLPNNPVFQWGRIITAGDGSPEMRFVYFDDVTTERSLFEFDNKGIFASVKPTGSYGSHWEGFMAGEVQPMFRLNSYPSMSFEAGQGSGSWTDAILRRKRAGHFHILSQLSGGTPVTGNLDVANIYSSEGHLHLSSTQGYVAISGNLIVYGSISGTNNTAINNLSGGINLLAGPNIQITTGAGFIMISGSGTGSQVDINPLNTFSASVNVFTASYNIFSQSVNTFSASQLTTNATQVTLNSALNNFTASQATVNATQTTLNSNLNAFSATINILTQSLNGFTSSFSSSVQSIGDARYVRSVNSLLGAVTLTAGPNITINTAGQDISITGSAGGGAVTGSTNFFVTDLLKVSGTITNPVGHLILSSTVGSIVTVSGNLKVTGQVYNQDLFTVSTAAATVVINFNSGSSWIINLSGAASDVTASLTNMQPGSSYVLKAIQGPVYRNLLFSGTGAGISGSRFPNSGSIPTMTSGNLSEDIYTIWFDGKRPYITYLQNWI